MAGLNVLVTGASGYLGHMVVTALALQPGVQVIATDLRAASPPHPEGVIEELADLTSDSVVALLAAHAIDTVVHLAAIVTPPPGTDAMFAHRVDVEGTERLLAGCLAQGVKHFVYCSSGAVYGYHADNPAALREDDPLRGNDVFAYAKHKRLVEERLAAVRATEPGLAQLVLRPGTVLGRGTRNQITDIFDRPVVMGLRDAEAPFVFVLDEDVAQIIARGVLEGRTGIYNVAGAGVMTLREIAAALHKPFIALPSGWVRGALTWLERLGVAPYGPEQVLFLKHRPVLDATRLRGAFGYTPRTTREVFDIFRESRERG